MLLSSSDKPRLGFTAPHTPWLPAPEFAGNSGVGMYGDFVVMVDAEVGVTRSGYHAWVERVPGVRAQADAAMLPLITQAHRESRQTYGRPRIRIWLQEHGQSCGRQRIGKLMRSAGLNSRPRRRFRPVSLTDSNHNLPVAPNRLRDLAAPQQRDAVWVADITYIETAEGWLYVAGVLDRCTRRCVG